MDLQRQTVIVFSFHYLHCFLDNLFILLLHHMSWQLIFPTLVYLASLKIEYVSYNLKLAVTTWMMTIHVCSIVLSHIDVYWRISFFLFAYIFFSGHLLVSRLIPECVLLLTLLLCRCSFYNFKIHKTLGGISHNIYICFNALCKYIIITIFNMAIYII